MYSELQVFEYNNYSLHTKKALGREEYPFIAIASKLSKTFLFQTIQFIQTVIYNNSV